MTSTRFLVLALLPLSCPRAPGEVGPSPLPADLIGHAALPSLAWTLDGFAASPAIVGLATDQGPLLLVSGGRRDESPARLGDLSLVAPGGWVVRRIVLPAATTSLPALLRQVILAADAEGVVHVLPLSAAGRESEHPRLGSGATQIVAVVVAGGAWFAAGSHGVLAADNLIDRRWTTDIGAPIAVPPATDGQHVYATGGRLLCSIDGPSGQLRWRIDPGAEARTGLLVSAGLVIAGFDDGQLRAFDTADGALVWQQAFGARLAEHLALAGPWLVAAGADGRLQAMATADGRVTWQAETAAPASSPVVAFGHVFVVNGIGRLAALPLAGDSEPWEFEPRLEDGTALVLAGAPTVYGRRLYAGCAEGRLVAIDLGQAAGPAPWPVAGGTPQRSGCVLPPTEPEESEPPAS